MPAEISLVTKLVACGQDHLFAYCNSPEDQASIIAQLEEADRSVGLCEYLGRARGLLAASQAGINPLADCEVSVPSGLSLDPTKDKAAFDRFEAAGLPELAGLCFVLVAGGLGERLGFPGIKISLPVDTQAESMLRKTAANSSGNSEVNSPVRSGLFPRSEVATHNGLCYMALFAEYILEYQRVARKTSGDLKLELPLAIMTSECTHAATLTLLEANGYFGLSKQQVTLMMQGKVPCLQDSEGRIAISKNNVVEMKPHGHGDVHGLLLQTGLAQKWTSENRKWLFFFQDTNSLAFRPLAACVGASKELGLAMNSFSVPRTPGEASGAIAKIWNKQTGVSLVSSIEYNLLGPMLATSGGDIAGPDGEHSPYPGNCNILLFELPTYTEVLVAKKGLVPEFVNPKYNSDKSSFKSPTRLECLMQDFALLMDPQRVGFTSMPRWLTFSVVKNTAAEGASKLADGQPADCAFSGECEWFDANCRILSIAAKVTGCEEKSKFCFLGVKQNMGPRVSLLPSFGITLKSVGEKIQNLRILGGARSSLVLAGPDTRIQNVTLQGALVLKNEILKDTCIENNGWELIPTDETQKLTPAIAMRGFTVDA